MSAAVDWNRAEQIALRIAARQSVSAPGIITAQEFVERASIAEERVEATTGLRSRLGAATVQVIDRPDWIRANITSFRNLLEPVMARWTDTSSASTTSVARRAVSVTRQIAAAEMGVMLGWMSGKVLGQYDLLVGDVDDDAVYLVGPNLLSLEHRFGFAPGDFRMWVTLHELTHRAQFTGVPWMRQHFLDLVHRTLELADPDPAKFLSAARDAMRDRDAARQRLRDGGLAAVVATPEQQLAFGQIAGLMSLLEGHGDVVMDRAGADLISGSERFGRVLRERRKRLNPIGRMVQRLVGLEGKLNQYAAGERFIAEIEAVAGTNVVNRCWERVENLPNLEEIRAPQLWLDRLHVERRVA
jgi:coenzyme F420 biosynthesis associated uncharacterized protein